MHLINKVVYFRNTFLIRFAFLLLLISIIRVQSSQPVRGNGWTKAYMFFGIANILISALDESRKNIALLVAWHNQNFSEIKLLLSVESREEVWKRRATFWRFLEPWALFMKRLLTSNHRIMLYFLNLFLLFFNSPQVKIEPYTSHTDFFYLFVKEMLVLSLK